MKKREKPSLFSVSAFLRCIFYAGCGIAHTVKSQRNMQLHLIAATLVFITGLYLRIRLDEWLWIVLAIALVWITELVNSAFEYLCDLVQSEYHTAVKHTKDIAAGAVLVAVITAVIIGLIIFIPYLKPYFLAV